MKQASQNHFDVLIFPFIYFVFVVAIHRIQKQKKSGLGGGRGKKNSKREDPLLLVDSLL